MNQGPAIIAAALLSLTPAIAVPPHGRAAHQLEPALLSGEAHDGVALIIGGSGSPIPPDWYIPRLFEKFLAPNGFADYLTKPLVTPEGLYPIYSGVKSLPFDPSVAEGVQILNEAIKDEIAAGHRVVVSGVSQSATIATLEMRNIANGSLGFQPTPDQLAFVLTGDPSNPNGGLLARGDLPIGSHPTIPSLGITFSGATPSDTDIPTFIYTREYDGFADFPRYPLNFVSSLNAVAGIMYTHPDYQNLDPAQIAAAIKLPTSEGYDGATTYYMIPTEQLPLAQLIEAFAGKPLADLLEPDLRVLANLGYGPDPHIGWSESPADVATPFGLFPSIDSAQFATILSALSDGAQKGFNDFLADLANPASWAPASAWEMPNPLDAGALPSLTDIVNALTTVTAQAYSALLPTADIINAMATTLPVYDLNIFTHFLTEGDLLNAIGMPIAANTGILTLAAGIEFMVIQETLTDIQNTLAGVFG